MSHQDIKNIFGNQVRVRVMGLLKQEQKLLVINHSDLSESNTFWAPPGGGVDFNEEITECLKREYKEEVNLDIDVGHFLFGYELMHDPLHAIELFFKINSFSGELKLGSDPESGDIQIIQETNWLTLADIRKYGQGSYHDVFDKVQSIDELFHPDTKFYLRNIH